MTFDECEHTQLLSPSNGTQKAERFVSWAANLDTQPRPPLKFNSNSSAAVMLSYLLGREVSHVMEIVSLMCAVLWVRVSAWAQVTESLYWVASLIPRIHAHVTVGILNFGFPFGITGTVLAVTLDHNICERHFSIRRVIAAVVTIKTTRVCMYGQNVRLHVWLDLCSPSHITKYHTQDSRRCAYAISTMAQASRRPHKEYDISCRSGIWRPGNYCDRSRQRCDHTHTHTHTHTHDTDEHT